MTKSGIFKNQEQVWKDYGWFYPLVSGFVILSAGIFIGHYLIDGDVISGDYGVNLYTEVVSIIATVLILDRLADRRRKREYEGELKQRLIRDARSRVNNVAVNAIEELRAYGWLVGDDGLLQGCQLSFANLKEANLWNANLKGATLTGTNLTRSGLSGTNLEGANLLGANLERAQINQANLEGVILRDANLKGANLWNANLKGAFLYSANLRGAKLLMANLDNVNWSDPYFGTAILPDGEQWTPEENKNLGRFTDRNHLNFEATLEKVNAIRVEMGLHLN